MLPRVVESATVRLVPPSASTRFGKRGRSKIRASLAVLRAPETQWRRVHGLPGSQQGAARGDGGAYVADTMAAAGAKPVMVNWEVVAKNLDNVTTVARAGWKRIAGRAD